MSLDEQITLNQSSIPDLTKSSKSDLCLGEDNRKSASGECTPSYQNSSYFFRQRHQLSLTKLCTFDCQNCRKLMLTASASAKNTSSPAIVHGSSKYLSVV